MYCSISSDESSLKVRLWTQHKLFTPVCPSIGWLVGQSVCHNFLKGQEVSLPCSYRSTCLIQNRSKLKLKNYFEDLVIILKSLHRLQRGENLNLNG